MADEETVRVNEPINPHTIPPSFNERSIFYIRRGGNPYGPYNLEALASVSISEDSDISLDGMTTWFKVREISGLLNTLEAIAHMEATQQEPRQPAQPSKQDNNEDISEILNHIQDLVPAKKQLFRRVFSTKEAEREFIISEYNRSFNTLLNLVTTLSDLCVNASLTHRAVALITNTVNDVAAKINNHYISEVDHLNLNKNEFTTSSVSIGQTNFSLLPPLENIEIVRIDFLTILGDKNLCVTYDETSETKAFDFVNNIVGQLYKTNPARLIVTNVIDTDFMTGLDDSFKLLDRDLYKVITRNDEVRTTLTSLQERASSILRNLLVEKGSTLQDYNSSHENKEANVLLILKNFPHGLNADNLDTLKKLANVGPKVGIYIVILSSKEFINEMSERETEAFDMVEFSEMANSYHFKDNNNNILGILEASDSYDVTEGTVQFDILSASDIKKIVKEVNSKCELKEDVVVSISENLPESSDWWSFESARQIEIPFGVGNDMHVKSLKITQESGQNTAIVIGIPGSGKSVFLHSLICSAAIKYSPDELRMYLIDFSGVEFNSYAIGKLPHARVIAPEAEREFGLSILNELVEEGSRRMTLCRDHNVSNIVDLKRVAPSIKVPRLLVIIDEFQKLFEIENDIIAKEANSKIHIIIQEFRKFGINLILATQKLPSSSQLPKDLIANRIVFKSAPADMDSLIILENRYNVPRLRTGQCIYNSESGAPYANEVVQGYFVSRNDIDSLLSRISRFEKEQNYERENIKVFRSAELPDFMDRRIMPQHRGFVKSGGAIPVYIGETISVNEFDVNIELHHEGGNNLLIIGGEPAVAQGICYHALLSISTAHNADDATFIIINSMRADNPMLETVTATLNSLPFNVQYPIKNEEVEVTLSMVKQTVDERRLSGKTDYVNIYIGIFDFQNCRAFDKDTTGKYEKTSEAAKNLEYIIKNGPSVGVFTIMHVDNVSSLCKFESSQRNIIALMNHRVALQMPENDSQIVIGDTSANKLFIFNRPSSRYRGYIRDNNRNILTKFKPYKFHEI